MIVGLELQLINELYTAQPNPWFHLHISKNTYCFNLFKAVEYKKSLLFLVKVVWLGILILQYFGKKDLKFLFDNIILDATSARLIFLLNTSCLTHF